MRTKSGTARHRVAHGVARAWRTMGRMWRDQGAPNYRAMIGVALATVILAITILSGGVLRQVLAKSEAGSQMVIYLAPSVTEQDGLAAAKQLAAREGVTKSEFVSRTATKDRLRAAFRGNEGVLQELEVAALPASIEVQFEPGLSDAIPASTLPAQLRALPEVEDLAFVGHDDPALRPVLAAVRAGSTSLAWVLVAIALVVAIGALRVGTVDIRREASVIELLGGPPRLWRLPVVLMGGLQGLAGAGAGVIAGYWVWRGLVASVAHVYPDLSRAIAVHYLSPSTVGLGLVAFAGLGALLASFAVVRTPRLHVASAAMGGELGASARPAYAREHG